ncbi:hypothetical protein SSCH_1210011 [Syntrophaceticus schinkii]|uniref:Uncharacterized protein n=1 Tax=Syntrophaceticus schinkii TaxID=499207 RepID=A0A0B7MJF3_9FIRM|nr:hypothetical protein SSCH_1210011 [Syntrophaceticus schinkii]
MMQISCQAILITIVVEILDYRLHLTFPLPSYIINKIVDFSFLYVINDIQ